MYKQKIIIYVLSFFLLYACSNDENDELDTYSVDFTIESSYSNFKVGDAIGLFVEKRSDENTQSKIGTSNYKANSKWIYQEDGTWKPASSGDEIYTSSDGKPLDIYAYYPYHDNIANNKIEFTAAVPIMTGRVLGAKAAHVDLVLSPKVNLVKVIVPDIDILSSTQVSMTNVSSGGTISLDRLGEENDFTASAIASDQQLNYSNGYFTAYLPSQLFEKDKDLLDIRNGDNVSSVALTEDFRIGPNAENTIITKNQESNMAYMPNSFMLNAGDEIFISVKKAFEMWQTNDLLSSTVPDLTGDVNAAVVWQEGLHEVVESLDVVGEGSDAIIHVKTRSAIPGNAVIAAKVGENIRWSWHLWISDYNPSEKKNGTTYDFNGLTFMDRNLGATTDPTAGGDKTFGLYYQWGRKDPLLTRGKVDTKEVEASVASNLANSVLYPGTHITSSSGTNDWYTKTGNLGLDRWNSQSNEKTVYDPCPKGWRVPVASVSTNSPWIGLLLPENEDKWGNGWYFDESQLLGYYPAAGQRTAAGGTTYAGSAGFYHTATSNSTMRIDFTSINFSFGGGKAAGRSVRCVKE